MKDCLLKLIWVDRMTIEEIRRGAPSGATHVIALSWNTYLKIKVDVIYVWRNEKWQEEDIASGWWQHIKPLF